MMIGRMEGKLDQLNDKVDTISRKLYGNGSPGLILDQAKLAGQVEEILSIAKANTLAISELKTQTPIRWLSKNWKTIGLFGVVAFVLLHSLLPADLSVWSFISKLFGGP